MQYILLVTKFNRTRITQSFYYYYAADRDKKAKEIIASSKVIYQNTFKDQAKRNFLIIELKDE